MAEKATSPAPKEVKKPEFTKKDLIESAAIFGVTPAIMTGALHGVKKEQLTREEARAAVDAFLKKHVKKGGK